MIRFLLLSFLLTPIPALALSLEFPSEDSQLIGDGVCSGPLGNPDTTLCFNVGDGVEETFQDTGLAVVRRTTLSFSMINNIQPNRGTTLEVLVNDSVIGSYDLCGGTAGGTEACRGPDFDLVFDHDPIGGMDGDDYTLTIRQSAFLPSGSGSYVWSPGGSVSLEPVPVPAAVWLFGSALGLLGYIRRNRGQ